MARGTVYVNRRPKPDDYIYTEDEVFTFKQLEQRIVDLEKNSGSGTGGVAGVSDVLVNGVSVVDNGVASIPKIASGVSGVVSFTKNQGLGLYADLNCLYITRAVNGDIDARSNPFNPIVPKNLAYAIKSAMCTDIDAEWTSEEKAMAQERMGLGWKLLGDVTVEEDGVVEIDIPINNPNYNEYQFYVYVAERKTATANNIIVSLDKLNSVAYALCYHGIGTNSTFVIRGHTVRHCDNGWLTHALSSNNGRPCNNSSSKAVDYYTNPGANVKTENPNVINVYLATGLDIGSRFVVYAR